MDYTGGFVAPNMIKYSLILKAHKYDAENPKSLQSITAERAGKLGFLIDIEQAKLNGLPMLFATRMHQRKYRRKYEWMDTRYRKRLDALQMLLASYTELIKN